MQRTKSILLSLTLLGALQLSFQPAPRPAAGSFVVVLDAGHGGPDPGAQGVISNEKDVALSLTVSLQEHLAKIDPNVKVYMTRTKDEYVGLAERAKLANDRKADLFVSIHCNANERKDVSGTETYAVGVHKSKAQLDVMMRENASILMEKDYEAKYEGFDPKSEESYIIFKLQQHAYIKQSLDLANKMEDQFTSFAKRSSRGVKQAGFLVLWQTAMPSVLVESGFISNPTEEKFLNSREGQDFLVKSMGRAILAYKKEHL